MSIETNFRAYLTAMNGTPQEFTTVKPLFDNLFHSDFVLQENDDSFINRQQMEQFQSKACAMGTKFTLIKFTTLSPTTIEYKFRSYNNTWDISIHNIATIKNNKLHRAKPIKDSGSKPLLLINFKAYLAAYDGTPKNYAQISHFTDAVYHDEFTYQTNGKSIDKHVIRQYQSNFFALGSKATLLQFKELEKDLVEFKFRLVNDKFDTVFHNIARVRDGKIVAFAPKGKVAEENVKKVREVFNVETMERLLENFRTYMAQFDGTPKSFSEVRHLFDKVYHEDFTVKSNGKTVDNIKHIHTNFFPIGSKSTLLHLEAIGSSVEFKICISNDKCNVVIHNIATVKDGKFIVARTLDEASAKSVSKVRVVSERYDCENESHTETTKDLLENFKAYMVQFDGTPLTRSIMRILQSSPMERL